ncbi:hypothetical protein M3231_02180 [Neobacillus mesonae]|nr:hypothetical protein [Neobacillus mesonae]
MKVRTVSLDEWEVKISYIYNRGDYLETPTITYHGKESIENARFHIYSKNDSGGEFPIDPAQLSAPITLPSRHSDPDDLDYIELFWNDRSEKYSFAP